MKKTHTEPHTDPHAEPRCPTAEPELMPPASPPDMDMATALICAYESLEAYNDVGEPSSLPKSVIDAQLKVPAPSRYENGSMVAWVRNYPLHDLTVISYRGTDDLEDWLVNMDIRKCQAIHGWYHQGFLDACREMRRSMRNREKGLGRLALTGHSLGGAMALVHAVWYAWLTMKPVEVYTFGQPRVIASAETVMRVNRMKQLRYWRFVNCNDIVPRVPSRLRGFYHAGEQIYFNRRGEMFRNRGFWGRIKNLGASCGRGIISDHDMERYCQLLEDNHEAEN